VEYDPFIKSQLASRNSLLGLMWCKFGHVTVEILTQRNPRTPPSGRGGVFGSVDAEADLAEGWRGEGLGFKGWVYELGVGG